MSTPLATMKIERAVSSRGISPGLRLTVWGGRGEEVYLVFADQRGMEGLRAASLPGWREVGDSGTNGFTPAIGESIAYETLFECVASPDVPEPVIP